MKHNTGGSRAPATSKMERFVIIVNGFQTLTIITKRSILDVAVALDPPMRVNERLNLIPPGFPYYNNKPSLTLS